MDEFPIGELLPHAGRMALLTGYRPPEGEDAVEAFVAVSGDSQFFDAALGGVPACAAIEYMAQTVALLSGLADRRCGKKARIGFLLGSRRLTVRVARFEPGETYRVAVKCLYSDGEFGSFDCAVFDARGEKVADGILSAFRPAEGAERVFPERAS